MTTFLTYLALIAIMLAPFALVATLAAFSHRAGTLGLHLDQVRFAAPMVGPLFEEERTAPRHEPHRHEPHRLSASGLRF